MNVKAPNKTSVGIFSKIMEQVWRFFGGTLPVSYELSGESIIARTSRSCCELVRVSDIDCWCVVPSSRKAVSIRLRDGDTSIIVGDHRGSLRELLERVVGERRVSE